MLTDESIREVNNLMDSKQFYITPDGELTFSVKTDTLDLVLKHMTDIKAGIDV